MRIVSLVAVLSILSTILIACGGDAGMPTVPSAGSLADAGPSMPSTPAAPTTPAAPSTPKP